MKSTLKRIILFIITAFSISGLYGQSVGTTSFQFLKNQYSARAAALGHTFVAIKGDVNGMFYNPASLSQIRERQWTIGYTDHLLDFQGGQLAYVQNYANWGSVGIGLLYFNYGDFKETNEFGKLTGREFGASEFALALSIANVLGKGFDYGLSAKFIYSSLAELNASAVALDAGLFYTVSQLDNLQIGISLSNVGTILNNYTGTEEKLPLFLRIGVAKRLAHLPLTVLGGLNDVTLETGDTWDRLRRFSLGGEFDVSQVIKLRLGYDNDVNRSVKPVGTNSFGGLSAGLGILWRKFRIDYAYSSFGELGSQNRLGITGTL